MRMTVLFLVLASWAVAADDWIGKKAPDLVYPDSAGKKMDLKSAPGTITIIDVWASWCGPCRKYMPLVNELYKSLGPYGVRVIGVNTDKPEREKEIRKFLEDVKVDFPIVYDPEDKISDVFQIDSIPRTLVIDDRQIIRFLGHPGELEGKVLLPMLVKQSPDIMSAGDNLPDTDARSWIRRGLLLNDNTGREAAYYLKALSLDPKNSLPHRFLAAVYDDQEEYDKAVDHLNKALQAAPQDPLLKRYASIVYLEAGQKLNDNSDIEIAYYDKAFAMNPLNTDALFAKATVYEIRKDWPNAIANYRGVLKLDPASSSSHRRLGKLLVQDGKLDEARTEFTSILKDSPDDLVALQQMGAISEKQDQLKDAVRYYGQVIEKLVSKVSK